MATDVSNISLYLGWGIVLLAVIVVMLIVLMRSISGLKQTAASFAPEPASPAKLPAPMARRSAGNEVIAVIAAAVAAYMADSSPGVTYKITGITPAAAGIRRTGSRPVWGFAGMRQNTEPF